MMSGWTQVWVSKLNERHWIVKQLLPRRINWVSKIQSDYWSTLKSLDSAIITDVGLKISWERRWKGTSCLRGPVQGGLRGLRGGHTRGHFRGICENRKWKKQQLHTNSWLNTTWYCCVFTLCNMLGHILGRADLQFKIWSSGNDGLLRLRQNMGWSDFYSI